MTNVYKVSDDGQLIERIATEEVKAFERAPRCCAHARRSKSADCFFGGGGLSAHLFQLR